jgi:hypothetical protein
MSTVDDAQSYSSEKSLEPPPKITMAIKGADFLRQQEEAETIACHIMDSIIETAATGVIENYYHSLVPEYEVQRTITSFNSLLEVCPFFLFQPSYLPYIPSGASRSKIQESQTIIHLLLGLLDRVSTIFVFSRLFFSLFSAFSTIQLLYRLLSIHGLVAPSLSG